MNLIKKLTGIFLIILYTLRIKKKPTQKVDNTDLNKLLEKSFYTKSKDEDQELVDAVIKDYKDKSQDQSGEYLLRVEEKKEQSETDYLLSSEANKKRLLESVENIKAKVEDRQEKIETKVEEIKKEFDQKKCADVIAKVAEKVFNESPNKMTGFQSIGIDRKKREVDNLKEKQSKGKKLNRKERNRISLYNKQNGISNTTNDTTIHQNNMINNAILISALDDSCDQNNVKSDSVELPTASEPFTGSGGSFSGGGASSSWSDDTPSKHSKPEPQSSSYTQTSSYNHARNDDYEYTPPTKSYSSSSSSSSSRSDDSSSYSSSYDSGSSYSSSDSSSSSSSDW